MAALSHKLHWMLCSFVIDLNVMFIRNFGLTQAGVNERTTGYRKLVYSAFFLGKKSIQIQSFIKSPASNRFHALPTFIKLRARKSECKGELGEPHKRQSVSMTKFALDVFFETTVLERNLRGYSDLCRVHSRRNILQGTN